MGIPTFPKALFRGQKRRRTSIVESTHLALDVVSLNHSETDNSSFSSMLPSKLSDRLLQSVSNHSSTSKDPLMPQQSSSSGSSSDSSSETSNSSCSSSMFAALVGEIYAYIKRRQKKRRTRKKSFYCTSSNFWDVVSFKDIVKVLGPEKFKMAYRMSLPTFKLLLNEVRDLLQRPFKSGTEYRRSTISPEIRLAITLRILAGGSCTDLVLAYHVEEGTVRHIFHHTCAALTCRLRLKGFPKTIAGLQRIATRFQTSRRGTNPLPGCVGALDGICIKIKKPHQSENPAMFYCRKGYYAIPVQALVDSDYIFRFCSAVCTGATHDALAFSVSGLKREIDNGALFEIFYIVGDDAYSLTNYVITPCSKSNADVDEDIFNFFQSSHRMHIEQAFGMLVARWRILRGGLQYSVRRSSNIICLLMKLHNFILEQDKSRSVRMYSITQSEKEALEAEINQWCRDSRDVAREFQSRPPGEECNHEGVLEHVQPEVLSSKRDLLIDIVKKSGRERPDVQLCHYSVSQDPF